MSRTFWGLAFFILGTNNNIGLFDSILYLKSMNIALLLEASNNLLVYLIR